MCASTSILIEAPECMHICKPAKVSVHEPLCIYACGGGLHLCFSVIVMEYSFYYYQY